MKFNEKHFSNRSPGLPLSDVAELNRFIRSPLSPQEIESIAEELDGIYDAHPSLWQVKLRDLPQSYLDLLAFSNGGNICNGRREIGYFAKEELRSYLLRYQFPHYTPGCLPFGLNGGSIFYIFDMRNAAVNEEYPILAMANGAGKIEDAAFIASNIYELIDSPINVEEILYPTTSVQNRAGKSVSLVLFDHGPEDLKHLLLIKRELHLDMSISVLKSAPLPFPLSDTTYDLAAKFIKAHKLQSMVRIIDAATQRELSHDVAF